MKINMYEIRDSKAKAFQQPWFERTHETAQRAVQQAMHQEGTFAQYTEDYDLYHCGIFNDENGIIEAFPPIHLASLLQIRDAFNPQAQPRPRGVEDPPAENVQTEPLDVHTEVA